MTTRAHDEDFHIPKQHPVLITTAALLVTAGALLGAMFVMSKPSSTPISAALYAQSPSPPPPLNVPPPVAVIAPPASTEPVAPIATDAPIVVAAPAPRPTSPPATVRAVPAPKNPYDKNPYDDDTPPAPTPLAQPGHPRATIAQPDPTPTAPTKTPPSSTYDPGF